MEETRIDKDRLGEWLSHTCGDDSISAIARKIGVPQRTLANHVNTGELTAPEVISIARAYGESPVFALEELGFLTYEELMDVTVELAVRELPIRDMLVGAVERLDGYSEAIEHFGKEGDFDENKPLMQFALNDFVNQYHRGQVFKEINVESDDQDVSEDNDSSDLDVILAASDRNIDAEVEAWQQEP